MEAKPSREFGIRWTERIYRLHLTGIGNHAPRGAGVFEIALFPPGSEDGEVIYVGWEGASGSVSERLRAAFENRGGLEPEALKDLQANMANAYFDAVSVADVESDEDLMDLAWAVAQQKKPRLNNLENMPHSGRYAELSYKEL
jgi:hypothetical protein